ncbi:hypothetical protein [Metabacillus fastidiosus]|uniref:hypothetical protein n=1 Tax=Metabacillus fastidiosus TaxID=1458 RepID=UPI003D2B9732
MKKTILGFALILALMVGCSSNETSGKGKGEIIEVNEIEVKELMAKSEPTFLYVSSPFESDKEKDSTIKLDISNTIKKEKIDVYDFNLAKVTTVDPFTTSVSEFNVKNNTHSLAFYQDSEFKEEIDLTDVENADVPKTIDEFIKTMKSRYLE